MRVRVDPPEAAFELVRYLADGGCAAATGRRRGEIVLEDGDGSLSRLRADGYLRVWSMLHASAVVEVVNEPSTPAPARAEPTGGLRRS